MPARYGTRSLSFNPVYWIVWAVGAALAFVVREIQYLWTHSKSVSGSERNAWTYRALLSSAIVVAGFILIYKVLARPDDPLALAISWLVLLLLPRPVPRLPLLVARFLAFGTTMAWLFPALRGWGRVWPSFGHIEPLISLLCLSTMFIWVVAALRPHTRKRADNSSRLMKLERITNPAEESCIPTIDFGYVGGTARVKGEIRLIAENRFSIIPPTIVRNGVLLYGPQGTGKNLLAETTAGEYRVNFHHLRCPELLSQYIGTTSAEIRRVFEWAAAHRPIVLFLDEIDSIGSRKQAQGNNGDPGGAGREYNLVTTQLMQSIDQYRALDGLLIIAATNYLDGLEPTLIREGRFDAKLRLDLPGIEDRKAILATQLRAFSSRATNLDDIARRTPDWSPARLRGLVERAALGAKGNAIEEKHLLEALERTGGQDSPTLEPVGWDDVVLPSRVASDLRTLIELMQPGRAEALRMPVPTGLILTGAPGTGKTLTARLLASQSNRSFYPVTPSDVLSAASGGSVQKLRDAFTRAKEHAPSILFFDEMDGLFPRLHSAMGHHDLQLVEQALIEISALKAEHNVFLVGTTNYLDLVDPRILRGGRFSEKIEIGLPDDDGYRKLIGRYLGRSRLSPGLTVVEILDRVRGISPADLEAVCTAMKRAAFCRLLAGERELPPLEIGDLEEAIDRIRPSVLP